MNKTEFIDAMAEKSGMTKADSKKLMDAFLEVAKETLCKGETINLTGFATLSVKEKPGRKGRNPKTGEEIEIAAKKVVNFKAGAELEDAVKNG